MRRTIFISSILLVLSSTAHAYIGRFTLKNMSSTQCLSIASSTIHQASCINQGNTTHTEQLWRFINDTGKYKSGFYLQSEIAQQCLQNSKKGIVNLAPCKKNKKSQLFILMNYGPEDSSGKIKKSTYRILSTSNLQCLSINTSTGTDTMQGLVTQPCDNGLSQQFVLQRITAKNRHTQIANNSSSTSSGTTNIQTTSITSKDQRINNVYMSWYGFDDSACATATSSTCDNIAFPKKDGFPTAHDTTTEDSGSYRNPITLAAAANDSGKDGPWPVGTLFYVPMVHKYFILEDSCLECGQDWVQHKYHVDLYMGPNQTGGSALVACKQALTTTSTLIVNPSEGYPVEQQKIYTPGNCTSKHNFPTNIAPVTLASTSLNSTNTTASPAQATSPTGTPVTPIPGGDGKFATSTLQNQTVWQTQTTAPYLYFSVPDALHASANQPLYVAVHYLDSGYQRLKLEYDSSNSPYTAADVSFHSSLVNSKQFATAYFKLSTPSLQKRENNHADFRITSTGDPVSIASVEVQSLSFPDPLFLRAQQKPWLNVISGNGNLGTLRGKVMAGYQGWFFCPNDLNDGGWFHWVRNNTFTTENFNTDMWPDMTAYPSSSAYRAGEVLTRSGKPAYVFSSTDPAVVQQHFVWMQDNNIDGIFLQRFLSSTILPGANPEWVLANVRQSAGATNRIWAIEYDITGLTDATVADTVIRDWKWLNDVAHIRQDSNYANEKGKPVVFVWGLPIRPGISPSTANSIIDFLKNDPVYGGNYVIGGIGNQWQSQLSSWQDHLKRYNGLLVWQPQNNKQDQATFSSWGIDWYPHVYPGFSWSNLAKRPQDYSDRAGGQFYWDRMYDVISSGADRMFIGMFDEYDEGTAILPMSDDAPLPPPNGRFLDNQGKPSTWWLKLSGKGKAMLLKQTPLTPTMPSQ